MYIHVLVRGSFQSRPGLNYNPLPHTHRVQECVNTARLFLNHIGMLNIESVQVNLYNYSHSIFIC